MPVPLISQSDDRRRGIAKVTLWYGTISLYAAHELERRGENGTVAMVMGVSSLIVSGYLYYLHYSENVISIYRTEKKTTITISKKF